MRISDWSSDVCSSDLRLQLRLALLARLAEPLIGPLQKVLLRHFQRARRKLPELGLQRLSLLLQCDALVLIGLFPPPPRPLPPRPLGTPPLPFPPLLLKAPPEFRNPPPPALLHTN